MGFGIGSSCNGLGGQQDLSQIEQQLQQLMQTQQMMQMELQQQGTQAGSGSGSGSDALGGLGSVLQTVAPILMALL